MNGDNIDTNARMEESQRQIKDITDWNDSEFYNWFNNNFISGDKVKNQLTIRSDAISSLRDHLAGSANRQAWELVVEELRRLPRTENDRGYVFVTDQDVENRIAHYENMIGGDCG